MSDYEWFDEYGLLHPDPAPATSTNGFLFAVEYYLMALEVQKRKGHLYNIGSLLRYRYLLDIALQATMISANKRGGGASYIPHPDMFNLSFSHDNMTARVSFGFITETKEAMKAGLKNWIEYLHPRDLIYYAFCAGGLTNFLSRPFLPLLLIIQAISCLRTYKKRPHGTFIATDSKKLAMLRCLATKDHSWVMWLSYHLNIFIINSKKDFGSVSKVYEIYFKRPDHPCRKMANYLWG